MQKRFYRNLDLKNIAGLTMIEVLVALMLLSITSLSIAVATISAIKQTRRSERNSYATHLAFRKLEELASIDPSNLTDSYDASESNLTVDSISYTRTTDVTVNADNSRTVSVTVAPVNASRGKTVTYQSTFALWGSH
jgi:Tfp pilus assembly protein PilV